MKSKLLTSVLLLLGSFLQAQNVGVGETAPTAKLEVKADGNANSSNALLVRNSDNSRLFFLNGAGSATFGNATFPSPGHLVGIHNGLQPARAHLALYATGALPTDAGATNRIGFSNTTNGFRQFEIQSYSGTTLASHALTFKYINFTTTPQTETSLLDLNASGTATFSGTVVAPAVSAGTLSAANLSATNVVLNAPGGSATDFVAKDASGNLGYKKGTGALGLNYIICISSATFPSFGGGAASNNTLLGEVRLWAGVSAPTGWTFCQGQILSISAFSALFSILGTTYGGNGSTTFALPDLRGAAPVQPGLAPGGRSWAMGERTN